MSTFVTIRETPDMQPEELSEGELSNINEECCDKKEELSQRS